MTRPLDTIIELQDALDRLRRAEAQIAGIPEWMQELHAEHQERKGEIDALEEQAEAAAAERRAAEAGISDAQEKLKRYQQQINEVTNQREYGALLQEIDTVKGQIATFEEEGLDAMERREQAQRALEEQRAGFADLDSRYHVELANWDKEKPQIAAEAEKLRGRVATLRERLPRPQLAQFERIYERTGRRALAPIRRIERPRGPSMWHCGACNYNVRPQVMVEVKDRGALVQCDSCKRILFAEEVEAPAETVPG